MNGLRWLKRRVKDTAVLPERRLIYRDQADPSDVTDIYVAIEGEGHLVTIEQGGDVIVVPAVDFGRVVSELEREYAS